MNILGSIATALVLIGVYYCTKPKLRGQYLLAASDCAWLTYSVLSQQWPLAVQALVLLVLNVQGCINWKKKGIEF